MPKDYASLPPNRIRRVDRAVNDEGWIKKFLHRAAYASIATCFGRQPFIVPRTFVFDEASHAIYVHGAKVGRFAANIQANPKVSLSVSWMGRMLPAETALEFSTEYAGVIVFGQARLIKDQAEASRALQLLLDKYFPHLHSGKHYSPISPAELKRTAVFRIDIEQWSGKMKRKTKDFPGAFFYHDGIDSLPEAT